MLRLIPSNYQSKSQPDISESTKSQPISANQLKRNSLINIGFEGDEEDNMSRKKRSQQLLRDFQSKLKSIRNNGVPMDIKDKIRDYNEPLYEILDRIFNLYNINIHIISIDQSDSAIRIEPTLHMGRVVQCLVSVAIVLSKFPYSFIKLIDLNKFSICKSAHLKKEGYEELFTNRVFTNAMFMLDIHNNYEKIQKFFYKVVLFHAKKKEQSIHAEWPVESTLKDESPRNRKIKFFTMSPTLSSPKSSLLPSPRGIKSSVLPSPRGISPPLRTSQKHKSKPLNEELKEKEELEVFSKIITNPSIAFNDTDPKFRSKALFLKEKLEEIDSVGVCKEWWDDLSNSSPIVIDVIND